MLASPTPPAYRILGPLSAGTPPPRGQQARVLGVLLLERGAVVPTVELCRWALGPDRADDAAQVHVLIARLRRLLREQSLPGRVTSATSGYRFEGIVRSAFQPQGCQVWSFDPDDTDRIQLLVEGRGDQLKLLQGKDKGSIAQIRHLRNEYEQSGKTHDIDLPPEIIEKVHAVLPRGYDAKSVEITFRGKARDSSEHRAASSE